MEKNEVKKQDAFVIGEVVIQPGITKTVRLPFVVLPNHHTYDLNLRVVHGHRPGKCLFISSTIHGD